MEELNLKNVTYYGSNNKASLFDLHIPSNWNSELILFIHGYMGYKDWGAWNLVESWFTSLGYGFCKFNMTHNGGTIDNPIDFPDLESFAKNSYYKELKDIQSIADHLNKEYNLTITHLIGHSRGGGMALLSHGLVSLKSITTWAAIADIEERFPKDESFEKWKNDGVFYRMNGRTKQDMPHSFLQYLEFKSHETELNIESACLSSKIPTCLIHGSGDTSVSLDNVERIAGWISTQPVIIVNAQHTFGSSQPWGENSLPSHLLEACTITLQHIQHNS